MESSNLQELEQIPGVGIVLTVEFSRSLAGKNLYNNLLQSHSRQFFTLKGIILLPGIRLTLLSAAKSRPVGVCFTYSAAQYTTLRIPTMTRSC